MRPWILLCRLTGIYPILFLSHYVNGLTGAEQEKYFVLF